ncbi:bifunctional phosphopantothenoylcysteine decarboxylase/phosphopantothenate synthase [Gephyromycinifex aptenodytis]|uniref:bifunctional phosphopantothenoylcysteine decarboxylase/phosphopantothenate synthase n=1 Tax=Gephyromycinifex aptenodytis TaxID=2716227 RepID=UPI001445F5BB|nr:bifunctional phosphopantothenoylcysteine decarboxylase/phosphopantothenate synthase [Gephyromycinifex aptenodytis]
MAPAPKPHEETRHRVVLGVSGGIAAYKACLLLRLLTEAGHDVTVVPTQAALRFVGEPTWSALSGNPVATDVFDRVEQVRHVRLGQEADLVVIAPATADLLARAAHGLADDLLTNVLLTTHAPVVFAPAMHTEMWQHPATQANVAMLGDRGAHIIEPAHGRLTGVDSGTGRLPDPDVIAAVCERLLSGASAAGSVPQADTAAAGGGASGEALSGSCLKPGPDGSRGPLAGCRVVISAGGTREPIDPVRFLGNRSSGKQGYALAEVACSRGAQVTLISTVGLTPPPGAQVVAVETALQMQAAVRKAAAQADVVVMAAAVADFRPAVVADSKIKKTQNAPGQDEPQDAPRIELVRNPDILAGLVRERDAAGTGVPLIVGFAAETGDESGDVLHHARAKLARKGADLLVANEVGAGKTFGLDDTTIHILRPGQERPSSFGPTTKRAAAEAVWDAVQAALHGSLDSHVD